MELVRAALGDHIDHCARGTAVLRRVAARFHLHLFDEVGEHVLAGCALDHVGRLHAVDDVPVLGGAGTVHREAIPRFQLLVDARRLSDERREVAVVWEQLDLLRADVRRAGTLLDVDDRRDRHHLHGLGDAADRQCEIEQQRQEIQQLKKQQETE